MHRTRFTARVTAAGLLAALALGCRSGPPTGEVRGQVAFQGVPVTEGTITFLNPTQGGAAEGEIKSDGSYALIGQVPTGEYVVVVTPPVVMMDTDPGKSPPAPVEKPARNIPRQYRQQGTTPLRATVKEGKNELNFDLKP